MQFPPEQVWLLPQMHVSVPPQPFVNVPHFPGWSTAQVFRLQQTPALQVCPPVHVLQTIDPPQPFESVPHCPG
jgi:hypothetical protein